MKRMRMKTAFVCAVMLSLFVSAAARADDASSSSFIDMSLEELMNQKVTSAGLFPVQKKDAPGDIFVFDQKRIDESTVRTMHQLLDLYTPGVSMSYHFFGSLIGQRGIEIDSNVKTLFMVDDENVNARTHMGYMLPLDVPLIGDIDRVEVVQGPGAIAYGSGAISGAVNMVTKRGRDYEGAQANGEYGPIDNLRKGEFSYGHDYGQGDIFLYFGVLGANGFRADPDSLALVNVPDQQAIAANGGLRLRRYSDDNYKATVNWNHGNFNLLAQFFTYHGIPDTALGNLYQQQVDSSGNPIPPEDRTMGALWSHTQLLVRPKYTFDLGPSEKLEISASAFAADIGAYDLESGQMMETWAQNSADEEAYSAKAILKTTRISGNSLAVGTSVSYRTFRYLDPIFWGEDVPGTEGFSGSTPGLTPIRDFFNWTEYAFFAEDTIKITDKLTATVGGRLDGVVYGKDEIGGTGLSVDESLPQTHYDKFVPRFSLAYDFSDTSSVTATYQEGFRQPDVANLMTPAGQEMVEPETMQSTSVNYTQAFTMLGRRSSFQANAYYNVLKDTIGWRTGAIGEQTGFSNTPDSFASVGGELILHYEPFTQTNWNISYSYSRPTSYPKSLQEGDFGRVMEVNENRDEWARYPQHMIKTDLGKWFFDKRLLIAGALGWSSGFPDIYTSETIATDPAFKGSRTQIDLMARYMITDKVSLSLHAENLTADPNSRPPWSAAAGQGIIGVDERLFYVSLQVKL